MQQKSRDGIVGLVGGLPTLVRNRRNEHDKSYIYVSRTRKMSETVDRDAEALVEQN